MKNKGLMRKIGAGIVGATALITANCASINPNMRELNEYYANIDRVKKELDIKNDALLERNLRNGYYSTRYGGMDLRTIAGIIAGTIKVRKTENGYKGEGTFSQYLQQDFLDKVCEIADTDDNKIVTDREARDALLKAYKIATN